MVLGLVWDAVWSTNDYQSNWICRAVDLPGYARWHLILLRQKLALRLSQLLLPVQAYFDFGFRCVRGFSFGSLRFNPLESRAAADFQKMSRPKISMIL